MRRRIAHRSRRHTAGWRFVLSEWLQRLPANWSFVQAGWLGASLSSWAFTSVTAHRGIAPRRSQRIVSSHGPLACFSQPTYFGLFGVVYSLGGLRRLMQAACPQERRSPAAGPVRFILNGSSFVDRAGRTQLTVAEAFVLGHLLADDDAASVQGWVAMPPLLLHRSTDSERLRILRHAALAKKDANASAATVSEVEAKADLSRARARWMAGQSTHWAQVTMGLGVEGPPPQDGQLLQALLDAVPSRAGLERQEAEAVEDGAMCGRLWLDEQAALGVRPPWRPAAHARAHAAPPDGWDGSAGLLAPAAAVQVHFVYGLFPDADPDTTSRRARGGGPSVPGLPPGVRARIESSLIALREAGLAPLARVHGRASVERLFRTVAATLPGLPSVARSLPAIARADLARYVALFEHGGLYLDVDSQLKRAGARLLRKTIGAPAGTPALLFGDRLAAVGQLGRREKPYRLRIAQHAFFAPRRHWFFSAVLNESLGRLRSLERQEVGGGEGGGGGGGEGGGGGGGGSRGGGGGSGHRLSDAEVLWATGPDVVTTVLHEAAPAALGRGRAHARGVLLAKGDDWPAHAAARPRVGLSRAFLAHEEAGQWRSGTRYQRRPMPPAAPRVAGIAMPLGRPQDVAMGVASLRAVRGEHRCRLPIEVWHARELARGAVRLLRGLGNLSVRRIRGLPSPVGARTPDEDAHFAADGARIKPLVLLQSRFAAG